MSKLGHLDKTTTQTEQKPNTIRLPLGLLELVSFASPYAIINMCDELARQLAVAVLAGIRPP